MKRVLERAARSHGSAARKKQQYDANVLRLKEKQLRQHEQTARVREARRVRAAHKTLREDWLLGPLAPRRDLGAAADTYGALEQQDARMHPRPKYKHTGFAVGDRVVVVRPGHRDLGRIGTIRQIKADQEAVVVEGLNQANVQVPEPLQNLSDEPIVIQTMSIALDARDVRLVTILPHPETGVDRDVVIQELALHYGIAATDPDTGHVLPPAATKEDPKRPHRSIAGVTPRMYIPWPSTPTSEETQHDVDTLRIEVEDRTWTPTLRGPPMPPNVIDELRGRYSQFRTRHDDAYIARVQRDEQMRTLGREASVRRMQTPLKERRQRELAELRAKGRPVLSDAMLERIGGIMAKNQDQARRSIQATSSPEVSARPAEDPSSSDSPRVN